MQETLKQTDRNGNDTPILAMISFYWLQRKNRIVSRFFFLWLAYFSATFFCLNCLTCCR